VIEAIYTSNPFSNAFTKIAINGKNKNIPRKPIAIVIKNHRTILGSVVTLELSFGAVEC
jgi:1-acyl-sn-glycerol-3-phosphate acyltransferase